MTGIDEQELEKMLERGQGPLVVFMYSPFCGTCKAAGRMIEVAEHLLPPGLSVVSANVNVMPVSVKKWRISSVPALLVFSADLDAVPAIYYSMGSVERILEYIRSVTL